MNEALFALLVFSCLTGASLGALLIYVRLPAHHQQDDTQNVVRLIANINCKVNLIALNPGPGIAYETPDPERVAAFQDIIRHSIPCFIRKPRGLDVYAACGQLKRMELTQIV